MEGTAEDDMSFCDDWDILQEEERLTRSQLAEAEEAMMKQYFASAEAKNEEKEMMEALERTESNQKDEDEEPQEELETTEEDQKKEEPPVQEAVHTEASMKTPSPPKKKRVKRDNICDIGSSPALRKTCKMEKTEIKFIQKKMQSPTKKITRSPHLPPAKKNIPPPHKKSPAKKKTPAMNTSPATKIQD